MAGERSTNRGSGGRFPWSSTLQPLFGASGVGGGGGGSNTASTSRSVHLIPPSHSPSSRGIRDDIQDVIRGLGPLVEQSHNLSLGTWLRHSNNNGGGVGNNEQRGSQNPSSSSAVHTDVRPDVVVSIDNVGLDGGGGDGGGGGSGGGGSDDGSQDSTMGQYAEATRHSPELRTAIAVIEKYMPFFLILLAKLIFDHKLGILVLFGLVITFFHANSVIRREVGKQGKRSVRCLLSVIVNLLTCIFFLLFFVFESDKLYYNLVFMPPFTVHPPSLWDLLFVVGITDFVLKLITVVWKAIVVALPACILPFQKKGKCYLFIEQTSQTYRSLIPIRPWLVYLLEAYEGVGKLVGIVLCAAYIIAKGTHLIRGFKEWRIALSKLMQSVTYGCVPSREQIEASGNMCPICQDCFRQPTVLNCKHIFCEECVSLWFDRERTCPMCRTQIADDPTWRDGATSFFLQLF